MLRRLESRERSLGLGTSDADAEMDEHAVVSIRRRRAERALRDRDQPLPVLAQTLGEQLLEPESEARQRRIDDHPDPCATPEAQPTQRCPEGEAGVVLARPTAPLRPLLPPRPGHLQ